MKFYLAIFLFFLPSVLIAGAIPENSNPNSSGTGWECIRGWYKLGQTCAQVQIPYRASLSYDGHSWVCDRGYKKSSNNCVAINAQETQKQTEYEQAIQAELLRAMLQRARSGNCETEYKTNAEVCVEVTGTDIYCDEGFDEGFFSECNVSLNYELNTDYAGGAYLDVDVECNLDIEYKGRQTYSTQLDSDSDNESHSLYANGGEGGSMDFNFSFSAYSEVYRAEVSSANCEINSVDMY